MEKENRSLRAALAKSVTIPFCRFSLTANRPTDDSSAGLMFTQPMILLLDLWSSLILGILYLSFGGIPYIFRTQYNLCVIEGFPFQLTGIPSPLVTFKTPDSSSLVLASVNVWQWRPSHSSIGWQI